MLSFRLDEQEVRRIDEWASRLDVDRTTFLREALMAHLARLAGEHDAVAYEGCPLTDDEVALEAAEEWEPAEDWSDLAAWLDERDAKG